MTLLAYSTYALLFVMLFPRLDGFLCWGRAIASVLGMGSSFVTPGLLGEGL